VCWSHSIRQCSGKWGSWVIFSCLPVEGVTGSTITSPGKYADTGIPALIEQAVKLGAQKRRLVAKIAGGANLFPNLNLNSVSIGEQNIAAVIKNLSNHNIPIVGKDVAGNHGRKMRFFR